MEYNENVQEKIVHNMVIVADCIRWQDESMRLYTVVECVYNRNALVPSWDGPPAEPVH